MASMLIPHFYGTEANETSDFLLNDLRVPGLIFFRWANELTSFKQVQQLCRSLKRQARFHDPILMIDQEGGRVRRLQDGFIELPSAEQVARMNEKEIEQVSYEASLQMVAAGIDLNLAPVVDVSSCEEGFMGDRCYGNNAFNVIRCAKAALHGMTRAGLRSCLKHFPGHGSATVDSHFQLPIIHDYDTAALQPYRELTSDAVMVGHLMVPDLDSENPATLSHKIITELLRKQLEFKGTIITDSLVMGAIAQGPDDLPGVARRAIAAGCDLLILGGRASLDGDSGSWECTPEIVQSVQSAVQPYP